MFTLIRSQLLRRPSRPLTMWLGILVATSGFIVLTGSVGTSRLEVTGTVNQSFRTEYDILVRPTASRDDTELADGLVRGNFLSQQHGGIYLAQVEQIAAMNGVDVAAPMGMVGYSTYAGESRINVATMLDSAAKQQVVKLHHTWRTDRGLTAVPDVGASYVYVTGNRIIWPNLTDTGADFKLDYPDADGAKLDPSACAFDSAVPVEPSPPFEEVAVGRFEPICELNRFQAGNLSPYSPHQRSSLLVAQSTPDGFVTGYGKDPSPELAVSIQWARAVQIAAIDPVAEASLVGLDQAVVDGRYLQAGEATLGKSDGMRGPAAHQTIPLLGTSKPDVDQQVDTTISAPEPLDITGHTEEQVYEQLSTMTVTTATVQTTDVGTSVTAQDTSPDLTRIYVPGPVDTSRNTEGVVVPKPIGTEDAAWFYPVFQYADDSSMLFTDTAFRAITERQTDPRPAPPVGKVVGHFDPDAVTGNGDTATPAFTTYAPETATAADDASRDALGDRPLLPSGSPAGYLSSPPQLLTTFDALKLLTPGREHQWDAPVSAVRIRVSGVTGFDEVSQERVRLVAERIQRELGLAVDITIGSSPSGQLVTLPAGAHGRPELRLDEYWTKKGVAVALVDAVDRKSLVLFCLVLTVCALFLVNAVTASVRTRRRELATLAAIGWPGHRLTRLVMTEVGLIGLTAGVVSAAVSLPAGRWLGAEVTWPRAALAIPVAIVLALLAGFVPARHLRKLDPMASLRPPVADRRVRAFRRGGIGGMSLAGVLRMPGRSTLGVLALAIGVAALTILTATMWQFQGVAQGSLLGDAVSIQVRQVDIVAAVLTALLGAFAIADLVYLNARERDSELATLRACGWTEAHLGRLVTGEGLILGAIGALTGVALGLAVVTALTGTIDMPLIVLAALVALVAVSTSALASLVAALSVRNRDLVTTLAADE